MPTIRLSDYLTAPTSGMLDGTPYEHLEKSELADFLALWEDRHRQALTRLSHRIHPTAQIHPTAIIGDDVIIGPRVRVWEFSTVRAGSVLCDDVTVGFNCEVTRSFVGERAVLGHRIGINRTLVGTDAHLSANLTVAAISMWSPHMSNPERDIVLRTSDGLYRCGTPQFGALIGDRVQTGNSISLGPGVALGRDCRIATGVTLAARIIPDHSVITAPHTSEVHVRRRPAHRGRTTAGA
ncbi:transferase [Streptomyces sp. ICN441]|uniref:Transferase n=1 Tax=Streptomyces tirandamycinicus TaxID=2174846 RepID=A0A2S1STF9_9ACTN|nr:MULTISPECIES: transferase [Streptomyces]AWI29668.1 transferase [Streptomyces tirandamycinicus]TFE48082.1 transferase [Streptomyces sp. ICN441]